MAGSSGSICGGRRVSRIRDCGQGLQRNRRHQATSQFMRNGDLRCMATKRDLPEDLDAPGSRGREQTIDFGAPFGDPGALGGVIEPGGP